MKYNKKLIGLIAGLVCLVLCVILLLVTCGGEKEPADPSATEQSTQAPTEATEEPTEATEATEEPTEEPTEATEPSSSGGSSSPGGTGGFTGGGSGSGTIGGTTDDTDSGSGEVTPEVLTVDAPGTEGNPYAELFDQELGSFDTVKIPAEQTVAYKVYSVCGAVLTIESADAYVVYDGVTYEAQEGVVTVALASDPENKPVPLQIGSRSAEAAAYTVSFTWPLGSESNPYTLTVDQIPSTAVTEQIGAGDYQYYNIYGVNGTNLTIEDPDARVVYGGVTYSAENGKILVSMAEGDVKTPVLLAIGNTGGAAKAVTLSFDYIYGTAAHPAQLRMGEFTTILEAGNDEGYYYQYTAEADGVVTLRYLSGTEGVECDYLLYNSDTGDYRTLSDDAITDVDTLITTVSIQMNQGDVLTVIVVALPAEDGTYPAAELKSLASFEADALLEEDDSDRAAYTVTVTDGDGQPMADVRLTVQADNATLEMTTNAEGVAVIKMPVGAYTFTLELPEGYIAEETVFELTAEAPERTIVLTKEEAQEPTEPEIISVDYTVTVLDCDGVPQPNVVVQFLKDGTAVALGTTDAEGKARATLDKGSYTVSLAFSQEGLYYDPNAAVLTGDVTELVLHVAGGLTGETEELYVGTANILYVGGTYVSGMQANVVNYFLFTPTEAGTYRFTTSSPSAVISYWGGTTSFILDQTASTDYADNAFTRNVKESNLGTVCIIGVTGASECVIEVIRTGDAVLDESDIPAEVYQAQTPPTAFKLTLSEGQSLTYVNIAGATADFTPVLGADGYYHLNSADGPILYVDLGPNAPYVSFYKMLGYEGHGGTSFGKTFRDETGAFVKKEDYTECMCRYVESIDAEGYGVYPMTEDLYYMLINGGESKGWWDSANGNYLFSGVEGLNTEIAWMFCCCYVQ
ncbi:MAG: Ig-like domain-containing protein [Oscillospiraceae bacterium]|nr:Ig-like domain-containing protein [Oscillospiraceae bacterium]